MAQDVLTITTSKKIIIMDDEECIRETFGELLKKMGCSVVYAADGTDLLESIKKSALEGHPFDAVIMDLTIPGGMGGKDAISELRKINSEIKAFVSSGYSDDPIMAHPENYGFTDKITKPFRSADLRKLMERWVFQ
jgi:two-component system, cell cycle sensor histidine kinase and response regulator CckA